MSDLRFSWDERKNAENKRKHSVSFEEAQTVFYDENAKLYHDPTLFMKIGSFCSASVADSESSLCATRTERTRR